MSDPRDDRLWQEVLSYSEESRLTETLADIAAFLSFLKLGSVTHGEDIDRKCWEDLESLSDADLAQELPRAVAAYVSDARMPGGTVFGDGLETGQVHFWRSLAEAAAAEQWHDEVFEGLHGRYADSPAVRAPMTSLELAAVMASLVGPIPEGGILDPACGTGNLLRSVGKKMGMGAVRAGQEIDPALARIAAYRLEWNGGPPTPVALGDSLRDDQFSDWRGGHLGSTYVLCDPPGGVPDVEHSAPSHDIRWEFGRPPRDEPEFAWLQHCYAHLRPGGTAIVVMPAAAASRQSSREIREEMLRSGALHEVIALPPWLEGKRPSRGACLWILTRPSAGRIDDDGEVIDQVDPAQSVLMTDASGFDREQLRQVQSDWWYQFTDDPGVSASVPVVDLLRNGVDLTPSRHVHAPETDTAAEIHRILQELPPLVRSLQHLLPSGPTLPVVPAPGPRVSIAELVQDGAVDVIRSHEMSRFEAGGLKPGDVLVPAMDTAERPLVVTDQVGDPTPDRHFLRCEPDVLDPYFLAGSLYVLSIADADTFRHDVRHARIPRIPLNEQRRYGAVFRDLTKFAEVSRQVADLSDNVLKLAVNGLLPGADMSADRQTPHN